MENTNPWLEITKQKEQPVFNETLIQNQIARLKYQKYLKTYEENTKEFQNPTVEDKYDPDDVVFVTSLMEAYESLSVPEFVVNYLEYFTAYEIEDIMDWLDMDWLDSGYGAYDMIDFLYGASIW